MKWTKEELISAVNSSKSLVEVYSILNLKSSNSHKSIKKHISLWKIDTSHFLSAEEQYLLTRKKISKSKNTLISFEDLFCVNNISREKIKNEFIKLVSYKCAICEIDTWQGSKLVLHLDHINGVNNDNRLENLRLLCPNCHSQTPTYCGKNLKGTGTKKSKYKNHCITCNRNIYYKSTHCKSCSAKIKNSNKGNYKIEWPDDNVLIAMIQNSNKLQVAKKLGVSYNAVRKRIKLIKKEE